MIVEVIPDILKVKTSYFYKIDSSTKNAEQIEVGSIVRINLRGQRVKSWVVNAFDQTSELKNDSFNEELTKPVIEFVGLGVSKENVGFSLDLARYYLCSAVVFLRAFSPKRSIRNERYVEHRKGSGFETKLVVVDPRADRRGLIDQAISKIGSTLVIAPDSHKKLVGWLEGSNRQAEDVSGNSLHSKDVFVKLLKGSKIVVGSRSAIFAPLPDCQSVIILDDSYEQLQEEKTPKWHVVDVAKMMCERYQLPLTIITSIPSVRTYDFPISDNRSDIRFPAIHLDDRTKSDPAMGMFSASIVRAVHENLEIGLDCAFLLNNVSAAKMLICSSCSEIASCEFCNHRVIETGEDLDPFCCEVCQRKRPKLCLNCGSMNFKQYRKGTTQLAKEIAGLFPKIEVVEVNKKVQNYSDSTDEYPKIYIATEQLFHVDHFTRNLGLVTFIDFDAQMFRPSMNAAEQALVLVNRAMRSLKNNGQKTALIISTFSPKSELIEDISNHDFLALRKRELEIRQSLNYAPYFATAEITGATESIESLIGELDSSIFRGKTVHGAKTTVMISALNHDELSGLSYEKIRKFNASNRCTISIDTYD